MAATPARDDDALGSMPAIHTPGYASHSVIVTAFDKFASRVTRWVGSPLAFAAALIWVVVWALTGPLLQLLGELAAGDQHGHHHRHLPDGLHDPAGPEQDSIALHLKLNELLAASKQASNRMIGIEDLDEQDLRDVAEFYVRLAARAKHRGGSKEAYSIDEEDIPTDRSPGDRSDLVTSDTLP